MDKIIGFIKRELVLSIATVLAIISMFFVVPDKEYIEYIDFRTLGILFSLMAVMEGLKEINVFEMIAQKMLLKVRNMWQLTFMLTMLCFFFSMLITNDVALITFVPLTLILLNMLGTSNKQRFVIPVVVMQTVAANLGSMLTPIGNPQNLYLYGQAQIGIISFIKLMLPYTILALTIMVIWSFVVAGGKKSEQIKIETEEIFIKNHRQLIIYIILFAICLLTVARIIPFEIMLVIIIVTTFVLDRTVLVKIDYSLLLTFVAFFIFIGNMGRIDEFRLLLESIVEKNELITAVISSQVISNVPAALLLSGFTNNYQALIVGTNIGGLGTLIASMASLISYKYVSKEDSNIKGEYMMYFTVANLLILIIMLTFEIIT